MTPTDYFSDNLKDLMRENAYDLVSMFILEQIPFRIVMWNMDDWDNELPEYIMESSPIQIILDIKDNTLEESYLDEDTGEVFINTYFEDIPYSKLLNLDDIVAITDLDGHPYLINSFKPDIILKALDPNHTNIKQTKDVLHTKKDVIEILSLNGIPKKAAKKSVSAFLG